jgi:signal transduction histidine kinase
MSERFQEILLIEDDEDDYILVEALLSEIRSNNYRLQWVATYEEALDAIRRNRHDAYLLDYNLGGGHSGLDLLEEAAAGGCTAPFILLTGHGDHGVDAQALKKGASDYLVKGEITAGLLERSIRYSMEQKRVEMELRRYESHLEELVDERTLQLEDLNRELRDQIANRKLMERQLRQAQKLEAIGTLAGGIAHDFNNILTTILGYSELCVVELPEGSPIWRRLQQVLKAAHRAKDLVQQLLTFSRMRRKLDYRPTDLNEIVAETVEAFKSTLPTTITVLGHIPPSPSTLLADPMRLRQLLTHLCTNAAQAMEEEGGTLEVSLSHELAQTTAPDDRDTAHGPRLKLSVTDTGHGMEQETLERIFDPYFTTKEIGKGSGLGLAVVHGIVKSHGGTTIVRSQPGKGTIFEVYLPGPDTMPIESEFYPIVSDTRS